LLVNHCRMSLPSDPTGIAENGSAGAASLREWSGTGKGTLLPVAWGMKKSLIYAVYSPPAFGLPYLAVTLQADGSATSRPFDTAAEASAFNKQMAAARHPGKSRS